MSCPCSESSSTNVSATGGVSVDDEVAQTEQHFLLDRAEQLQHGLHRHLLLRCGRELVERRLGIAIRAARASVDQRQRLIRSRDALAVRDPAQLLHELGQPWAREDERLAARPHGRQNLREIGCAEDEDEVRRRLLDQFQQGVPCCVRQLVRLVEDVHLVAAFRRLEDDAFAYLPDVVDPR